MAVPSASGSGIVNKGTTYQGDSQVTSGNLNSHVDDAVFNLNAVDGVTINADDNGKNLFVIDGSISVAKTSFLGTVDVASNSTTRILSKQSDGQYDSVTPSGDATMTQAGAITIADDAVTVAKTSFLGTVDTTANSTTSILSKQSDGEYDSVTPSGDATMSQAGAFTIATDAVTPAKTSFLGTVDTTANSATRILSKQSDGEYDSVAVSGDVSMTQAGAFTIQSNAVEGTMLNSNTVDDSSIELNGDTLSIKNNGVTTDKILNSNVTKAKIENVANMKALGNTSGSAAAPQEVSILDEDNMSSNSATSLATQQSIKSYVDTEVTAVTPAAFAIYETTDARDGTGQSYWRNWGNVVANSSVGSFGGTNNDTWTAASTGTYYVEFNGLVHDDDTSSDEFFILQVTDEAGEINPASIELGSPSVKAEMYPPSDAKGTGILGVEYSQTIAFKYTVTDTSNNVLLFFMDSQGGASFFNWEGYGVVKITKLS